MQEIIIDNSVTNYDQCYLKAIEEANHFYDTLEHRNPNEDNWLYKEIKKAINHYGKKAGVM